MKAYLDNAATTPLDERVFDAMKPYLLEKFGNPSSIHGMGREVRSAIEKSRKKIAELLNTSPAEIFFTSGGTEADNMAISSAVDTFGLAHIITSKIEHHAVLHTVEALEKAGKATVSYVNLDAKGHIDYAHLEAQLKDNPRALVSLMHGNNEIGNLTDIDRVGELCQAYGAYFHSDTVQTVGHFAIDLQKTQAHAINASAHKFHGPKGVGFIFIRNSHQLKPLLHGGGQERDMRGGTENVAGIVGLATALEIACTEMESQRNYITGLKNYCASLLREKLPSLVYNGDCMNPEKSLYTVLNVGIPNIEENDMLLFNLDINGVYVSGGSACASGADIGSHVLDALNLDPNFGTIRFSFSKYNTREEIDYAVEKLAEICNIEA